LWDASCDTAFTGPPWAAAGNYDDAQQTGVPGAGNNASINYLGTEAYGAASA